MGKKSNELDEEDKLLVTMDAVSDERAWCMFASAALPGAMSAINPQPLHTPTTQQPSETTNPETSAAKTADAMLALFKLRFRQDEPEADKRVDDDDDDDDDDNDDEDEEESDA